jgi:hypothetical protein
MANIGLVAAQTLPRFLLPKLSWHAGHAGPQSLRTLSTVAATLFWTGNSSDGGRRRISSSTPNLAKVEARSSILKLLQNRRSFHATTRQLRDHHFDTLKFVERLKEEGFTEEQSVAMMKVLSDVIEER